MVMLNNEYHQDPAEALVDTIGQLAGDPRFQQFLHILECRRSDYVRDMANPAIYNTPSELTNTAGRISELTWIADYVESCRESSQA